MSFLEITLSSQALISCNQNEDMKYVAMVKKYVVILVIIN